MNADVRTRSPLVVDDLSRRTLLGALSIAGALVLAGCTTDTETASGRTRTVCTPQGEYTVPADPKRVVCIDYYSGIFLTELGLAPVGGIDYSWVDASSMFEPYIPKLRAIPDIGEITATNTEKVAARRPDLILGPTPGSTYDNSPGAMAKLAKIAPTATIDFGATGDWRGPYEQAADEVNRVVEHDRLKQAYLHAVARVKAARADAIASTTIASLNYAQDGNFSVDLAPSSAGVVYSDLGLTFTAPARGTGANGVELSTERLDALADATMIVYRADTSGAPQNGLADVLALPAWQELPAVKAGNVFPITWIDLCGYRWAQSALEQLDALIGRLKPVG